ncbi:MULTISPECIES: hypothetical protein [Butyricimonas]|uniref:hypothetical protein n=1 Tax=Butyricimonas TaxID=574697 RepID=UPI001D05D4DE|nr:MULTISPECIES: hypothetical protein [Butyricimonas]MCB6971072.1 hypothetical protein [Butyricimonas synergistica]MCG4517786.1 hypothetical protein [Butyricimonas sp. DFI.6.44]
MQDLYLFNPDNEISVANGTNGYTPKANIALMADNLSFLMAYLTGEEDYVLVSRLPGCDFLERRREVFGLTCKPILWDRACLLSFREVRPWGWSPRVHNLLGELKTRCGERFRQGVMAEWNDERRELYSRQRARECLEFIRQRLPLVEATIVPRQCFSLDVIREITGEESVVVKAPWSSSGKGILFIPRGEFTKKEEEIVSGMLHKQGFVMVEKRLNRVLDFAMEFKMDDDFQLQYLGFSVFETGKRGEYEGNVVASESRLRGMISAYADEEVLERVRELLTEALLKQYRGIYTGYLGVDMMIYQDEEGRYRVQPCVEINLRYNMGIVALQLQRHLAEEAEGRFCIRFSAKAGEIRGSAEERRKMFPLEIHHGKVVSGYINLTPVDEESRFVAELIVEKK